MSKFGRAHTRSSLVRRPLSTPLVALNASRRSSPASTSTPKRSKRRRSKRRSDRVAKSKTLNSRSTRSGCSFCTQLVRSETLARSWLHQIPTSVPTQTSGMTPFRQRFTIRSLRRSCQRIFDGFLLHTRPKMTASPRNLKTSPLLRITASQLHFRAVARCSLARLNSAHRARTHACQRHQQSVGHW